uniref:RUN and SH3 domain containing 1 n=1 Tax=Sphenodon punctatus TaxID=8508 RepID=A0A8D0HJA0_SPHPU
MIYWGITSWSPGSQTSLLGRRAPSSLLCSPTVEPGGIPAWRAAAGQGGALPSQFAPILQWCICNTLHPALRLCILFPPSKPCTHPAGAESLPLGLESACSQIGRGPHCHLHAPNSPSPAQAQLGDSRLSPDIGYLVLHSLCPALYTLVEDGLKPFQKDVITGQRRISPWSVVEASAKPGPHTRSLNTLYWRVSRLPSLGSNRERFHAFILGLLNIKQLELWFSHLQKNSGMLSMLYLPTGFLRLSQGPCPCWGDELLLLLQPLSVLTFQLDLLFEHHHLSLDVRPPAPRQAASSLDLPAAPQQGEEFHSPLTGPRAGAALHQGVQRVLLWGDRLSQTLLGSEAPPKQKPGEGNKQGSWWEQLSQASRVYISSPSQETSPFPRWSKLHTAAGNAAPPPGDRGASSAAPPAESKLPSEPGPAPAPGGSPSTDNSPGSGRGRWLGRLFGANWPSDPDALAPKSRRPSSWLPPSMNVLALVLKASHTGKPRTEEPWEKEMPDLPQPHRYWGGRMCQFCSS